MELKKARYYDGRLYADLIDPILKPIRHALSDLIEPGGVVVDIGCGTGALAIQLCKKCEKVIGIDSSEPMIRHASRIRAKQGIGNLSLICANALSVLADLKEYRVDYAIFSMVLHETKPKDSLELIMQARQIADHILCADYRVPLRFPQSAAILMIEKMAGREHFRNFRNFSHARGLFPLISAAGLTASLKLTIFGGNVCILKTDTPNLDNFIASR